MEISFDAGKRARTLRERGLDLADAAELLASECFDVPDDRFDYGEDRWVSFGELRGEVIACVWADWGDDHIRVISMWKATRHEQETYYRSRAAS